MKFWNSFWVKVHSFWKWGNLSRSWKTTRWKKTLSWNGSVQEISPTSFIHTEISFLYWILESAIINIFLSISENKILSAGNNFVILKCSIFSDWCALSKTFWEEQFSLGNTKTAFCLSQGSSCFWSSSTNLYQMNVYLQKSEMSFYHSWVHQ